MRRLALTQDQGRTKARKRGMAAGLVGALVMVGIAAALRSQVGQAQSAGSAARASPLRLSSAYIVAYA